MEAKVREAEQEDVTELIGLDEELSDQHAEIDDYYVSSSGLQNQQVREWLNETIAGEDAKVLVFEAGQSLVGYFVGVIEETKPFIAPDREGRIAVIYVKPGWREHGFARTATERFKRFCKEKDASSIRLSVHTDNPEAVEVWRSLGFREYMKRMRLEI
ncbi:MAG: GNAT family N-acetyltransferase [Candidatus Bipolaricaulota bacterium]